MTRVAAVACLIVAMPFLAGMSHAYQIPREKPKDGKPDEKGKPKEGKQDDKEKLSPELKAIVDNLKSKDVKIRVKACEDLKSKGEEAEPAAKFICNALMDNSSKVSLSALEALEKVSPPLYKHISVILLDSNRQKQYSAFESLGKMGEDAIPAIGVMVQYLKREVVNESQGTRGGDLMIRHSTERFPGLYLGRLIIAVQKVDTTEPESIKILRNYAGPLNSSDEGRVDDFLYLVRLAGDDETKKKALFP